MPPTEEDLAWFRSTFHPIPKPALPDDCIEYSLHLISTSIDASNDSETRLKLREVQKAATELTRKHLKEYIWQRQSFAVELNKEEGLSLLRGRTEYGDSVEDEWVIVWLLRELTKQFNDLWVKVTDSDGEFLLIEASGTLPDWLQPEVAENRVWINNGQLKIIKPAGRTSKRTDEKLSLQESRQVILNEAKRLMHSVSMEEEAFYRLRNYPAQITESMHHAIVRLPRKVAFLLHEQPAYVAPAIEAFYLRDPIALKPLQSRDPSATARLSFPPEDFVTVGATFPRVGYAQLKSQDFPAPAAFESSMPTKTSPDYAKADTGMKLTCGFEMLLSDKQHQDKPAVREMHLLLEDLASGEETLPSDDDVLKWQMREDDEKWLDISFEDLESELNTRSSNIDSKRSTSKKADFGDKAAQENLQRIVKQFEEFLNDDEADADGAGMFDDDDDYDDGDDSEEDKDASFDEEEFTKMMQEMMGMPPEVMREIMTGDIGEAAGDPSFREKLRQPREDDSDDEDDEEDEDMLTFMRQMESELRPTGVLNLNSNPGKAKGAIKSGVEEEEVDEEFGPSSDDDIDHEIDINLARNLLESLKAQAGRAGPGGNLMGMMGLAMPRDEGGSEDDEVVAGPSSAKGKTSGT